MDETNMLKALTQLEERLLANLKNIEEKISIQKATEYNRDKYPDTTLGRKIEFLEHKTRQLEERVYKLEQKLLNNEISK